MSDRRPNEAGTWRDPALDLARGVAVLAMVWVHFVPESGADASGAMATLPSLSVAALDGFPAVLFLLLVGASAATGGAMAGGRVLRRAACLGAIGMVFWRFVWPNDILLPIAMMTLVVAGMQRLGLRAIRALVLALLFAVPFATWLWGAYAWTDVREDGTHIANHEWGWGTWRYFLFDGAYPLLPWLVFPLCGLLLARIRHDDKALRTVAVAAATAALLAWFVSWSWGDEYAGGVAAHLDVTWQPTSLPFVALWGGAAVAFQSLLMLCLPRGAVLYRAESVAAVGRASLTHYLAHLVVVYSTLRIWWPAEDWSTTVGIVVAIGYMAIALGATRLFSRGGKAPVEALLARCSGR